MDNKPNPGDSEPSNTDENKQQERHVDGLIGIHEATDFTVLVDERKQGSHTHVSLYKEKYEKFADAKEDFSRVRNKYQPKGPFDYDKPCGDRYEIILLKSTTIDGKVVNFIHYRLLCYSNRESEWSVYEGNMNY
jgi:hypothetical protein